MEVAEVGRQVEQIRTQVQRLDLRMDLLAYPRNKVSVCLASDPHVDSSPEYSELRLEKPPRIIPLRVVKDPANN